MRFLCAIRIVCWRVSVFYVAAVSAIPADGVPCGGRVLHGHLLALPPRCLVGWRGGRASRRQKSKPHLRVPLTPRRASAAQGHAPLPPHRAPPLFLPPPPANKKFRKSSWGFGGFFQEAPNASLPPAPLITAAASGASTMPGMPNRRKPAYMESRDRRGWMPSERPTRCGSAISRRTEEIA